MKPENLEKVTQLLNHRTNAEELYHAAGSSPISMQLHCEGKDIPVFSIISAEPVRAAIHVACEDFIDSLNAVGLRHEELLGRYPHQLSGGERQRFMLARIHLLKPKLIVADEPVSMLDASLRAMFLDHLKDFINMGMSCLYITHDLNIAYFIADRIVILCNGNIVEEGDTDSIVKDPLHPYTQELIGSIPTPDPRKRWTEQLSAEKIGLHKLRDGEAGDECVFVNRCPQAMPQCSAKTPHLSAVEDREHQDREVACYLYNNVPA